MRRNTVWRPACIGIALLMCGAAWAVDSGVHQDVLRPAGPQAAAVRELWHVLLLVCALVFAIVLAVLALVLHRRPRATAADAPAAPDQPGDADERRARRVVAGAVAGSGLLLVFLIVVSFVTDRALARLSLDGALRIEVTGNQWWWDVRYDDEQPSRIFFTANELVLPVGRPVVLSLRSSDVIHSFWLPALHGKKDLIPGRTAQLALRADQPGVYRGQCAEFCGTQHSFMALQVRAVVPAEYEAWAAQQRQPAAEPAGALAQRGRTLFLSGTCVMCHAVQGTDAAARKGPDLTHLAGRSTLAAGTLPNSEQDLARWIRDPQHYKPGVNMPASDLPEDDLRALVAYLRGLS
jgi:cytochrome c oxidase subunit 2